ncbi:hypothetical protein FRC09_007980, partial [Ceratobasidium sp. 395]
RTRPLDPNSIEDNWEAMDGWRHKRQRPIDEHVTTRRPRQGTQRNHMSPSSIQANSSFSKSASPTSTCALPGRFPSDASSVDSQTSESSLARIFWSRAFMSMRSTLAEVLNRLTRMREAEERRATIASPRSTLAVAGGSTGRTNLQMEERRAAALSVVENVLQDVEPSRQDNPFDDGGHATSDSEPEVTPIDVPQTTIMLGGHTIQLTSPQPPRLLSGIRLAQPVESAWPPPRPRRRRALARKIPQPEGSGMTEIDPDAQRRPECGYRDNTPSVHANSLYEM